MTINVSHTPDGKFMLAKAQDQPRVAQFSSVQTCESREAMTGQLRDCGVGDSGIQSTEDQLNATDTAFIEIAPFRR